jgi:YVTN family beta-propeller protein
MVNIYIANNTNGTVSIVDDTTIVTNITVGSNPSGVAVTPDGTKTYVANYNSNNISVIDNLTNTILATITVGTSPISVAITPDNSKAYVVNQGSNSISRQTQLLPR